MVWNQDSSSTGSEEVSAVGAGVRFRLLDTVLGDVAYVIPTDDGSSFATERPDNSVLFRLTKFF